MREPAGWTHGHVAARMLVVLNDRCPAVPPTGFAEFAPDLAIEALSPSDRPGDVLAKVGDWLSAGALLVWLVDPSRREARVSRRRQ